MSEVMVNTILCFMSHQMKLMPMEGLSKLFYVKVPESVRPQNLKRFIHRQSSGKDKSAATANASDIYSLLQTMDNGSSFSSLIFATVPANFLLWTLLV